MPRHAHFILIPTHKARLRQTGRRPFSGVDLSTSGPFPLAPGYLRALIPA